MTNIPAGDTVTLGESVVTAGIELETGVRSTYPKGLLIGTIVDVSASPISCSRRHSFSPSPHSTGSSTCS